MLAPRAWTLSLLREMIGSDVCAQCGKPEAKKRCSQCKCVFYCSADCQRAAWPAHKGTCFAGAAAKQAAAGEAAAAAAAAASAPPPPRTGGSWDDVSERQLLLALSDDELAKRAALLSNGAGRTPLLTALSYGIKRKLLRVYGNAPRYDRLVVSATAADGGGGLPGAGSHTVEMEIDAYEGKGWWMTKDCTEAELTTASEGLQPIQATTLETEYAGALGFLEACKKLGAPRYVVKTELDPENALPHVLAVVERVLGASSLRFLLAEDALNRADANP